MKWEIGQILIRTRGLTMPALLKILFLVAFVVAAIKADDDDLGMTLDEMVEAMAPFGAACDPVPEAENIRELLLNKEDAQPNTKCFRHCMMQQFELMNADNTQMNTEKTAEMMGMLFPDKEEDLTELINKCNAENKAIEENCEAAHAHGMCMLREMKARGYKIPEIKE